MSYISRKIEPLLDRMLKPGKAVILTGARRVGKTELAGHITQQYGERATLLNGEDYDVKEMLAIRKTSHYKRLFRDIQLLIIDEAQTVPAIGQIAKLIIDEIDDLHLLLTGSSSFDLVQATGEPLTGRKADLSLYPLSLRELEVTNNLQTIHKELDQYLIYGNYPELQQIEHTDEKKAYLKEIVRSYLLKDLLYFSDINNPDKLMKLLQLIAWQTGSEVSYQELGQQLGMSKNTVERYLHLLEHVFVLFRLKPFSKNLRKEISKSSKWYFVDNGIRNAVINQFGMLHERNDTGQLWENYVIAE